MTSQNSFMGFWHSHRGHPFESHHHVERLRYSGPVLLSPRSIFAHDYRAHRAVPRVPALPSNPRARPPSDALVRHEPTDPLKPFSACTQVHTLNTSIE